jgi:NADPH:quinone reductase-like Zn-dependent oxidoreductase
LPASMLSIRQETFGGPEVMRLVERDRPEPMGTEVLVRVHAAGVNPVDWVTRAGDGLLQSLPLTVGWDVSGVVEEAGLGVTRFVPGDEVFGMPWFPREAGAYAQYVAAPSRQLARKPAAATHAEAAGLPLAGLTAWQVLVDNAAVQPGQRVLITAAAGGVGHLAVQIAKALGAHVTGTARAAKHDFVRALGADEVVDYTTTDPAAAVADLDVVFDSLVGQDAVGWLPAIRPGGVLVSFDPGDDPVLAERAAGRGIRVATPLVEPDGHGLEALAGLVDAGRLRVEIERVLPLAQAPEAHAISEAGRTRGKIVLKV